MKMNEVAKLLEGIAHGLADLSAKPAEGLGALSRGIQPFCEQTVEQFVQFLAQCDEYKRTGVVSGGRKAPASKAPQTPSLGVTEAANKFRGLLAEINQGTVTTPRIDSMINELNGLKKPDLDRLLTTLEIAGKSKSKSDAIDKIRTVLNSQVQMYVKVRTSDVRG